jgi:hypothetical protein
MVHKGPLIYLFTFPNGKQYVGQTVGTFESRASTHKSKAFSGDTGCRLLSNAIKKYGWESIKKEILVFCDDNTLDDYETKYIHIYDTMAPNGYNLITGGNSNKRASEQAKLNASIVRKTKNPLYIDDEKVILPMYIQRVHKPHRTGFKIAKHPKYSSKQFCDKNKSERENLGCFAIEFLAKINNGEAEYEAKVKDIPKGIQKHSNGFRVEYKNNDNERIIKTFTKKSLSVDENLTLAKKYLSEIIEQTPTINNCTNPRRLFQGIQKLKNGYRISININGKNHTKVFRDKNISISDNFKNAKFYMIKLDIDKIKLKLEESMKLN